ncbi:MAG: nucleoside hydrolase [Armatimonadota bacterium]|nr:MAG: nucleoside hydrolase [Armatimonadota bacterium]
MPRVWLDTDIGTDIDDAVALLCAARHPGIDLLSVSTVWSRLEARTWLAREMLRRAGLPDIPVLPGAAHAAADDPTQDIPSYGRLAPDLPRLSTADDNERIAAIADAMMALPQPFHIVPVGPLTNVARLLERHPEVSSKWEGITCMAGRLEESAEYNVQCDPSAARVVFDRLGPRLVGLEASSNTLTREEAEAALDPSDPASAFLLECYRHYRQHAGWHDDPQNAPLTLFDPIALLSLVQPKAFNLHAVRVLVESDGRMRLTDDGSNVFYAFSSDWDTLKPLILELLRGSTSLGEPS